MLFNSFEFLGFLLLIYAAYAVLQHRWQNWLLLVGSYVFYGRWDWRFLSLILISTVVDYFVGQWIQNTHHKSRRRALLTLSMVTNLGILATFKYYNFFAESLADMMAMFDITLDWRFSQIVLPVGISFYTFQTMSYTIDIYRGQLTPTKNFRDFALFVSFFPQLVAGPIERASRLLPQVIKPRTITYDGIREGLWLILLGYFKKVVLADNLAFFTEPVFSDPASANGVGTLVAVYAFAWQIYGDFAGYTDIARGVAKLMGFELMLNFRMPYFATNPSDFWQRWHISLSSWLRDYLYIPLGGSRCSPGRIQVNLMTTMVLGGLWHGASWHFVVWGIFQGTILIIHRMIAGSIESFAKATFRTPRAQAGWRLFCIFFYFHVTCVGMMLFAIRQMSDLPALVANLGNALTDLDWVAIASIAMFAGPVVLIQILCERSGDMLKVKSLPRPVRLAAYCGLLAMIVLFGVAEQHEFIYFQF